MTKLYQYKGKQLTVKDLVSLSDNIGYDAMLNRLKKGWAVEDAIKTPLHIRPGSSKHYLSPLKSCDNYPCNRQALKPIICIVIDHNKKPHF